MRYLREFNPGYMKRFYYWMVVWCLVFGLKNNGIAQKVNFPSMSEPNPIRDNGKEHLLASYYGINSFSKNQRYATLLETDIRDRLPTEEDEATLGMVDLETMEFTPLTTTRAWNFQQGCMAHWLGTSPDSLIIFNDLREGEFVSVILNVYTRTEERVCTRAGSISSPDAKH